MILGDRYFVSSEFRLTFMRPPLSLAAREFRTGVRDPHRYGVVEMEQRRTSHLVRGKAELSEVTMGYTGLYFYDNSVVDAAREPSPRREASWRLPHLMRCICDEVF